MNERETKARLVVTALAAQQIYAQCHDECIEFGFFKHDLKMHSKTLVSKLEKELMPLFKMLGDVQEGDSYLNAVQMMEETLKNLATLPVEYWALVYQGISDIKRQIDEKNQAGADGVPSGTAPDGQPRNEGKDNGGGDGQHIDAKEDEAARNPTVIEKV
jgi:hypothetical protein